MHELRLLVPESRVEAVSDALEALGALSVSVEDADALTGHEQAMFGEPGMPPPRSGWQRSRMAALFADLDAAQAARQLLVLQPFFEDCRVLELAAIADADWVRLTQSQFVPVEITPAFWIVPSWHEPPSGAERVIRVDPGLAFGTGTHPTTQMCLRRIAVHVRKGASVLDYGCGSGILAIAAALHGAAPVDAVDIDPAAVEATRANAEANGAAVRAGLPDLARGHYDMVVANILASPLKVLAPLLCGLLAPEGQIVLAGILDRQAEEIRSAYASWVRLDILDAQEGWILMGGSAPG